LLRIDLQFNRPPNGFQRVAKNESGTLERPEQIRNQRKAATFNLIEKNRGAARRITSPLNFRDFQMSRNRLFTANEVTVFFQVLNTSL
jgi:hypothetical protein